LSVLERAEHILVQHRNAKSALREETPTFVADTAQKANISPRSVQADVKRIAEKDPAILDEMEAFE
jgi:hypothetical protein